MINLDTEYEDVIKKLIKNKVLIPMKDCEDLLYHGRAGDVDAKTGKIWHVDPNFKNGGNATGHKNVYGASVLYASSKETAKEFAAKRVSKKIKVYPLIKTEEEIHKIVPKNEKSYIFNNKADLQALLRNGTITRDDLMIICGTNSKVSPLPFEYAKEVPKLEAIAQKYKSDTKIRTPYRTAIDIYSSSDVEKIWKEYSNTSDTPLSRDVTMDFFAARNTRAYIFAGLWDNMITKYLNNENFVKNNEENGIMHFIFKDGNYTEDVNLSKEFPINLKSLSAIFSDMGLVGSTKLIWSATLNKTIDTAVLFDLNKIEDEKFEGARINAMFNIYGNLATNLGDFSRDENFMKLLNQNRPESIINALLNEEGNGETFRKYLKESSGVWEGFTIGEHTETVLRAFEDQFSTSVPENLKPFIRLVCLMHDLDKSVMKKAEKQGKSGDDIVDA